MTSFRDQSVFVTGASGFLGWHVAQKLAEAGAKVKALVRAETLQRLNSGETLEWIEGDLLSRDSLDAALRGARYVFHVAGDYRFWAPDPRLIYANNVQGTINILEAAKAAGVERIVVTSTTGVLERGTLDRLADESRLASPDQLKGPYKRSKFDAYIEVEKRARSGWPIISALPTAPIGPRDIKPTPTGMIIVQFLNGKIPMLARTGLNFVDVRSCAHGHLLAMTRGRAGERYLLGGENLWLGEFLQRLEPFSRYKTPRHHAPFWLSYATACVSESIAARWTKKEPFVTRESVKMSRGPHFSSNRKAIDELGYQPMQIDDAIRDAVNYFVERGFVKAVPTAQCRAA